MYNNKYCIYNDQLNCRSCRVKLFYAITFVCFSRERDNGLPPFCCPIICLLFPFASTIFSIKYTNTQMYKYANTQIHKYTNIQRHKYTETQIYKYKNTKNTQIYKYTNIQMRSII